MAAKRVLITQSNYIPWKGYFDAIASVDEVVLLDTVQFTKRDWRNRNRIKTPNRTMWLTIPVRMAGNYTQLVNETRVADANWAEQHWKTLLFAYGRSPHFVSHKDVFEHYYRHCQMESLSIINEELIRIVCEVLGIMTPIRRAEEFADTPDRNRRLLEICLATGASDYFSGPSAAAYLDHEMFRQHGVRIHLFNFSGYAEYFQPFPPFDHHVSILDLIFNTGDRARSLYRSSQLLAGTFTT